MQGSASRSECHWRRYVCIHLIRHVQDAYLLAQLLSSANVTKDNVPLALKVYDEIRRPFSQNVAALSLLSGRTSQLNTPQHADLTEEQSATGTALTIDQLRENLAEKLGSRAREITSNQREIYWWIQTGNIPYYHHLLLSS